MKNISFNYLASLFVLVFVSFTFTQCEKDLATSAELDIRGLEKAVRNNGEVQKNPNNGPSDDLCNCLFDNYEKEDISSSEETALLFMIEEEKLARDVYDYLYELWDYKIFDNISNSEQRHMNAIACLIEKYELDNPIGDDVPGVFTNQQLADLYTTLTDKGKTSLEEAFIVGATIEDLDIADLIAHLANDVIDNNDIKAVFGELTKGSRNHLRAFIKNLNKVEVSYEAVYITEELFQEIINSDRERGSEMCEGALECEKKRNQQAKGNGNCDGDGNGRKGNGQGNGTCDGTGSGQQGNGNGQGSGTCDGTGTDQQGSNNQGNNNGQGNNGSGNNNNGNNQGNGNNSGNGNGQGN